MRAAALPNGWSKMNSKTLKESLQQLKFALYSGHDNTLAPLLAAMGKLDGVVNPAQVILGVFSEMENTTGLLPELNHHTPPHPPMASSIIFELYSKPIPAPASSNDDAGQEFYIRMCYNGKPMVMSGCNTEMCPLDQYLKIAESVTPKDYSAQCKHVEDLQN